MSTTPYVSAPQCAGAWTLADVTVVDPAAGSTAPHRDVRIEAGRIVAVEAHDPARPAHASVDGAGRFVIPAFVDAHTHVLNHPDDVDGTYALMLAAGVAGYRMMSGNDTLLARRASGTLPTPPGAPSILAMPGDLLTPLTAPDERGAAAAVRHQAERGADFIKAGMTSRATFLAALREANRVGIRLGGHLPDDIDPREAAREGTWSFEHLGPGTALFAAASPHEERLRAMAHPAPRLPRIPGMGRYGTALLWSTFMKIVINPDARTDARTAEGYRLASRDLDEGKARELAGVLREAGTWQCATLIRLHTQELPGEHRSDARLRWMAPEQRERWEGSFAIYEKLPTWIREVLAERWEAQRWLTRILAEEDVPMVAGTDADDAGWIIPGFGLHDEFDLLADAGVPAAKVLASATSDTARFLGREDVAGAVKPGYEADLVVLGGDPTRDVAALHDIRGVVRQGGWRDRTALDEVLARVEAAPSAL